MRLHLLTMLACCTLLAACGDRNAEGKAQGEAALPQPAAAGGSVTGMPNPGVARAQPEPVVIDETPEAIETPTDAAPTEATAAEGEMPSVPPVDAAPAAPEEPAPVDATDQPGDTSP